MKAGYTCSGTNTGVPKSPGIRPLRTATDGSERISYLRQQTIHRQAGTACHVHMAIGDGWHGVLPRSSAGVARSGLLAVVKLVADVRSIVSVQHRGSST